MKVWLILTFCFTILSVYGQNPHDTPSTAFPLNITPTGTLNYITKNNINAQIEDDGTPTGCSGGDEYDVFGKIQTDANITNLTIHMDNIEAGMFLMIQVLDENMNDIFCGFYSSTSTIPFGSINPNSIYYIKILDVIADGAQEGTFDIAVTSTYNAHDVPSTAFPLTITPTGTLNYITKNNINAQIEDDGTPQACNGGAEYDVFGKIQTDANMTNFVIHFQNIDPNIFLTVQLLDENFNDIACTFFVGSGTTGLSTASPNSTYYLKLLDDPFDGLHEGTFDIAVTSTYNAHDVPSTAFPLTVTPTGTLNYITKDNINAQKEEDGTPTGCSGGDEYDVFGKIQTDANTTDLTIHVDNIEAGMFLMIQVLDENMQDIGCGFYSSASTLPLGNTNPNSTYYIKILEVIADGAQEGTFDIAVTSNTVLPVEYTYIRGNSHKNKAIIRWETAQEVNSSHFIVREHLPSGQILELDKITAAGNTSEAHQYLSEITYDQHELSPSRYYSLAQYDFDGQFEISETIAIHFDIKESSIEIPTLVHQPQVIVHVLPRNKTITASITSMNGQHMGAQTLHEGINHLPQLPPGQYAITLYDSFHGFIRTECVVVY